MQQAVERFSVPQTTAFTRIQKDRVDLRIRSIPVTVASRAGYLFSSEDLTEYVRQR